MSIKFGAKPVEFEKGKAGIVVGSKYKLPALIDALIAAVRARKPPDCLTGRCLRIARVFSWGVPSAEYAKKSPDDAEPFLRYCTFDYSLACISAFCASLSHSPAT